MEGEEFQRGITIPVAQSGCLFVAAGGLMAGLALWQGWARPWELALGAGSLAAGLWVFSRFVVYWDVYLGKIGGPGYESQSIVDSRQSIVSEEARVVRVELRGLEGRQVDLVELPVRWEQLVELARGVVERGLVLSEERLTGRGKIFSKDEWNELRDEMVRRGLLEWRSESSRQGGMRLTAKGFEMLRAVLSPLPPSPPQRTAGRERDY